MVNGLTVLGESAGVIWHQAFALCGPNWMCMIGKGVIEDDADIPLPQRLVLPLLQNLHSLHSIA